jgi:hypothetical protein
MRCTCCDRLLNDFESTRKSKTTGEYLDMCNKCYTTVADDIKVSNRTDLEPNDIPDDEYIIAEDESNYLDLGEDE